jgi:hypothetical protein
MLGTLRRNATDDRADLAPAGTVSPCYSCGLFTELVSRAAKEIGELQGGQ